MPGCGAAAGDRREMTTSRGTFPLGSFGVAERHAETRQVTRIYARQGPSCNSARCAAGAGDRNRTGKGRSPETCRVPAFASFATPAPVRLQTLATRRQRRVIRQALPRRTVMIEHPRRRHVTVPAHGGSILCRLTPGPPLRANSLTPWPPFRIRGEGEPRDGQMQRRAAYSSPLSTRTLT